jgi:hypothetical protein
LISLNNPVPSPIKIERSNSQDMKAMSDVENDARDNLYQLERVVRR